MHMQSDNKNNLPGTLAIDLGNTNTVIAFQGEKETNTVLIDSPRITSEPGVVPTAVWFDKDLETTRIGMSAIEMKRKSNLSLFFYSNFKRLIGNPFEDNQDRILNPKECGEIFFKNCNFTINMILNLAVRYNVVIGPDNSIKYQADQRIDEYRHHPRITFL